MGRYITIYRFLLRTAPSECKSSQTRPANLEYLLAFKMFVRRAIHVPNPSQTVQTHNSINIINMRGLAYGEC